MTAPSLTFRDPVGTGPLLVLGPSLGTDTRLWDAVLPRLTDRFTVAAWDLPGHGDSRAPAAGFTVGDLADAVAAELRRSTAPAFYAGVSLGGAVGLHLALRHPDLLAGLGVIASGAAIGTPEAWADRAARVRREGTADLVEQSASRWVAAASHRTHADELAAQLRALRDADDEAYALCCEALARHDVRANLSDIRTPTLVVWGAEDAVTPQSSAEEIAHAIPRASIVRVDGAAHLPPLEQPERVAALLSDFFSERSAASS